MLFAGACAKGCNTFIIMELIISFKIFRVKTTCKIGPKKSTMYVTVKWVNYFFHLVPVQHMT